MTKPFDLRELVARIKAVLRRLQPGAAAAESPAPVGRTVLRFAGWSLDPAARTLTSPEQRDVALTAGEFDLLNTFATHPGLVLSRAQLEEKLYGWNETVGSNAVEVHIHNLRKKLGEGVIRNVRGMGYTLAAE